LGGKTRHNVVFKLHPDMEFPDVAAAVRARAASGRHVFLVDGNIHALIAASEAVVVISSGVGFEALIHGKPVVTLGNPDYRWVTCRAKPDELGSALTEVKGYGPCDRELAYKLVYFYYHKKISTASNLVFAGPSERVSRPAGAPTATQREKIFF